MVFCCPPDRSFGKSQCFAGSTSYWEYFHALLMRLQDLLVEAQSLQLDAISSFTFFINFVASSKLISMLEKQDSYKSSQLLSLGATARLSFHPQSQIYMQLIHKRKNPNVNLQVPTHFHYQAQHLQLMEFQQSVRNLVSPPDPLPARTCFNQGDGSGDETKMA